MYSPNESKRLTIVPSPLVSFMNSVLYPRSPLVGTRYSIFENPFSPDICVIIPFLKLSLDITEPAYSSGTETTTSSIGSSGSLFGPLLSITSGFDTASS